ncbi:RING-type domain-containing protein [Citrus sinensis]|uniref:E3 ubiquitin-protein ligase At3g02290 isoform X2 n=1 Tax=Citrus sinensis TaxID=2711 RepID=UPI00219F8A64|nr:E3 ubiquitin-protein ligase At3g02290 isoform X2 [Citrus sinensis]KAH9658457.1 RING-type domain-containing protein [Citrus sinensis]
MGSFCCCPCIEEFEDYTNPSNSIYRNCICLRFFFHQLLNGYGAIFHRLEGRSVPISNLGTASSASSRDGLVSRRDKSMIYFQEDAQPIRRNMSSSGRESLGFGKKQNVVDSEEDCKLVNSESSDKALATKAAYGPYTQTSTEDEDVCPTCLDEYTPENPKITTRCSHHFHLGCIYEWLERSESCPICGKEMEFCESP